MSRYAAATAETLEAPDTTEPALALRAREGDQEAFVELYRRHKGPLYRHAYRMLRSEAAAHDVVQESFVRAITAIGQTREELHFKAWIFRIATNLCLRQLTARTRWVSEDGGPAVASTDGRADPEQARRRVELAHFVAEALEATPAQYRQILLLRELEELSYDELARVLGTSVPRVKVTLHRARSRFGAEFVAAQLQADPSAAVTCKELDGQLTERAERRELVRHLETCKSCRQRERRPAAELFAFLPAIIEPPALALPPAPPPPAPAVSPSAGLPSGVGVGAAALLGVGLVGLVFGLWMGRSTVSQPPLATATARGVPAVETGPRSLAPQPPQQPAGAAVRPWTAQRFALPVRQAQRKTTRQISVAGLTQARRGGAMAPGRASRRAGRRQPRHRLPTKTSRPARAPAGIVGQAESDAQWARRPLDVALALAATPVQVRRGRQRFQLRSRQQLRPGDILHAQGGGSFGLRLPGDQWLGVGGTLHLVSAPRRGDGAQRIRVALLAGWLRAKATTRGRGLAIRVGQRVVSVDSGELRIHRRRKHLRLETLDAYATVTGGKAARNVSPRTGLSVALAGEDSAGSSGLLAAPTELRPLRTRSVDAPRLSWAAVAGASHYVVQLARDTDFIEVVSTLRTQKVFIKPTGLAPGRYYWHVVASDGALQGRPSKIFRFVVLERD